MDTRQLRPALVLSAWTVVVWTTRIRNIWTDDSLSGVGQLWRTALALVFTAFAVVVIWLWSRGRRASDRVPSAAAPVVRAFAAWTVAVWVVRGVQIALADHSAAFIAVHSVLALVSIGLAVWAARSTRRAPRRDRIDA